jgi:hypothetical protein
MTLFFFFWQISLGAASKSDIRRDIRRQLGPTYAPSLNGFLFFLFLDDRNGSWGFYFETKSLELAHPTVIVRSRHHDRPTDLCPPLACALARFCLSLASEMGGFPQGAFGNFVECSIKSFE